MGLEAHCTARWGERISAGDARLEEKHLYFRGEFRLRILLAEVRSAEARRGVLTVKFSGGTAAFELGAAAEKWALKIRYPRSRIEKLGVKPGARVVVLGLDDAEFDRELAALTKNISRQPGKDCDFIFLHAPEVAALKQLRRLRSSLKPAGALWVVWPKGQPHIKEDYVRRAALAAGLVDVKVMSFSDALSALKLMIPRRKR
jgi:hypothetical protein